MLFLSLSLILFIIQPKSNKNKGVFQFNENAKFITCFIEQTHWSIRQIWPWVVNKISRLHCFEVCALIEVALFIIRNLSAVHLNPFHSFFSLYLSVSIEPIKVNRNFVKFGLFVSKYVVWHRHKYVSWLYFSF